MSKKIEQKSVMKYLRKKKRKVSILNNKSFIDENKIVEIGSGIADRKNQRSLSAENLNPNVSMIGKLENNGGSHYNISNLKMENNNNSSSGVYNYVDNKIDEVNNKINKVDNKVN